MLELMLIEADARRYITEAIETDKELAQIEQKEKELLLWQMIFCQRRGTHWKF